MTPTTTKALFPLDQSLHPGTAYLLDNDGSANDVFRSAGSDEALNIRAEFSVIGGTRKRRAAPSDGSVRCTPMSACWEAWARACSTGRKISNPARTMERAAFMAGLLQEKAATSERWGWLSFCGLCVDQMPNVADGYVATEVEGRRARESVAVTLRVLRSTPAFRPSAPSHRASRRRPAPHSRGARLGPYAHGPQLTCARPCSRSRASHRKWRGT